MIEVRAELSQGGFRLEADFTVGRGVTVLFGRSGSGKSTTANLIAGLARPDRGRVVLDGETLDDAACKLHLPAWRRRIGYVFQDARLFPHLKVRDNLLYGARRRGLSSASLGGVVDLLGLGDLLDRSCETLSGGERRRVAIGRALLSEPRLLILDEPLAGLDGARRAEILPFLDQMAHSGPPILYITHAIEEAARLADDVLLAVDGRIACGGPPDLALSRPAALEAAGLTAPISVLEGLARTQGPGPISSVDLGSVLFQTPTLKVENGTRVRIIVDARDVALALRPPVDTSFQNCVPMTVVAVASHGDGVLIQLEQNGLRLASLITRQAAHDLRLATGRKVVALIKATASARYV